MMKLSQNENDEQVCAHGKCGLTISLGLEFSQDSLRGLKRFQGVLPPLHIESSQVLLNHQALESISIVITTCTWQVKGICIFPAKEWVRYSPVLTYIFLLFTTVEPATLLSPTFFLLPWEVYNLSFHTFLLFHWVGLITWGLLLASIYEYGYQCIWLRTDQMKWFILTIRFCLNDISEPTSETGFECRLVWSTFCCQNIIVQSIIGY